jgi:hypothetical protein
MGDQAHYSTLLLLFLYFLFLLFLWLNPVFSHCPMGRQQITWRRSQRGNEDSLDNLFPCPPIEQQKAGHDKIAWRRLESWVPWYALFAFAMDLFAVGEICRTRKLFQIRQTNRADVQASNAWHRLYAWICTTWLYASRRALRMFEVLKQHRHHIKWCIIIIINISTLT